MEDKGALFQEGPVGSFLITPACFSILIKCITSNYTGEIKYLTKIILKGGNKGEKNTKKNKKKKID